MAAGTERSGTAELAVADVGGTSSRFAHFSLKGESLHLRRVVTCLTAELRHSDQALSVAAGTGLPPEKADALVWALAGPVCGPTCGVTRAPLTNVPLTLDVTGLSLASRGRARLINDFAAQAWATLTVPGQEAVEILPGADAATGPRAVLGAGTGLGMAVLLPVDSSAGAGRWQVMCSEGGHAAFPLLGREERELGEFVRGLTGTDVVSAEHVLSGRGLERVHYFLTGKDWPVERVAAEALTADSATLRLFARLYGRACGQWALQTLSTGGLYVTGGVAVKNPQIVRCPDFAAAFLALGREESLRRIPVRLMTREYAGLWGAARAAAELLY